MKTTEKKLETGTEEILGTISEKELFERLGNLKETKTNLRSLSKARSSLEEGAVKKNLDRWFFERNLRSVTPLGDVKYKRLNIKRVFAWFAHNDHPSPELFDVKDAEYVSREAAEFYGSLDESDIDAALSMIDSVCDRYSQKDTFKKLGGFLAGLVETGFVAGDARMAERTAEKLASLPATMENIGYLARLETLHVLYDVSPESAIRIGETYREKLEEIAPTLDMADFLSLPETGTGEETEFRLASALLDKKPSADVLFSFAARFDMPNEARLELLRKANEIGVPERSFKNIRNICHAAGEILILVPEGTEELHLPIVLETCRMLASLGAELTMLSEKKDMPDAARLPEVAARAFVGSLGNIGNIGYFRDMEEHDLAELLNFFNAFEKHFDKAFVGCDVSEAENVCFSVANLISAAAELISVCWSDEIRHKCTMLVGSRWFGHIEPSGGAEFIDAMRHLSAAFAETAEEEGAGKDIPAL